MAETMTGVECIGALRALGEETRLRILRLLLKERLSVNEISEQLHVSQYNISKHLRVMREAQLVDIEKCGQQRLYTIAAKHKTPLTTKHGTLDLGCCVFRFNQWPK